MCLADCPVHGDSVSLIIVIRLRIVATGMLMMTLMKDYAAGFYMSIRQNSCNCS